MLATYVSGPVGGVNAAVYNAVPLTTRTFEIYPNQSAAVDPFCLPMKGAPELTFTSELVAVPSITPLINNHTDVPERVIATCVHRFNVIVPVL